MWLWSTSKFSKKVIQVFGHHFFQADAAPVLPFSLSIHKTPQFTGQGNSGIFFQLQRTSFLVWYFSKQCFGCFCLVLFVLLFFILFLNRIFSYTRHPNHSSPFLHSSHLSCASPLLQIHPLSISSTLQKTFKAKT